MHLFQWSDSYNAQVIVEQFWDEAYEWFRVRKCPIIHPPEENCLSLVEEVDDDPDMSFKTIDHYHVYPEMIDNVMIEAYKYIVNVPPEHHLFRSFADWAEDLDANAVDVILQLALFNEVRYS